MLLKEAHDEGEDKLRVPLPVRSGMLSYRSSQMPAHASTEGMDRHVSLRILDCDTRVTRSTPGRGQW